MNEALRCRVDAVLFGTPEQAEAAVAGLRQSAAAAALLLDCVAKELAAEQERVEQQARSLRIRGALLAEARRRFNRGHPDVTRCLLAAALRGSFGSTVGGAQTPELLAIALGLAATQEQARAYVGAMGVFPVLDAVTEHQTPQEAASRRPSGQAPPGIPPACAPWGPEPPSPLPAGDRDPVPAEGGSPGAVAASGPPGAVA
jgi:hypothetical protein